ncbi:pancreatic lipase-related protein 2 [Plutella xylostella]|uniref:pancreatic lipase-related protein 2 n=1 Tax=Plutella xylostella TaxID=51655 RepID=UPI002032A282|nr:pancreatic lipase-related protein 2 [Plutella xylostella]
MARLTFVCFVAVFGIAAALPWNPVISKLEPGLRYQYVRASDGAPRLEDMWRTVGDLRDEPEYRPDVENVYHLFTRENPTRSQPLLLGSVNALRESNFDASRKTVVLVHGFQGDVVDPSNLVILPAVLQAADVNVFLVDWSAGAAGSYRSAVANVFVSGESVGRFLNWLSAETGASAADLTLVGHSLGGQQVGVIGRSVDGDVGHIASLDPAYPGFVRNTERLKPTDALYTEVIHTDVGLRGYPEPLGDVDFYPNGGNKMPGCPGAECSHDRAYYYYAESVVSGGFTGTLCRSHIFAISGQCDSDVTLDMGGLDAKTGFTPGSYYLETNAGQPFSKN